MQPGVGGLKPRAITASHNLPAFLAHCWMARSTSIYYEVATVRTATEHAMQSFYDDDVLDTYTEVQQRQAVFHEIHRG